jgi:hypothetical protein
MALVITNDEDGFRDSLLLLFESKKYSFIILFILL